MRRLTLAATLAAALALPAAADAAFFPAEVIDGPTADVVEVGDVDLARDGTGAMVYVKKADGANHVFVSRFVDGAFQPAERVDGGLPAASSQPVVGAADAGRIAIAYVNEGSLFTVVKARDAPAFAAPTRVAEGGVSNPSIDMSINGATYVSYTQSGDVKVARAERDTPTFTVLGAPADVDASKEAGTGTKRSRVVTSADGTALVVWGETGSDGRSHVFGRRLFELRLSNAPQDLTLDQVDGQAARDADLPELDMEDDSSFAQVIFRQNTATGSRLVMRRLVGSAFEAPVAVDQNAQGNRGRVDLTGRGEGLYGVGLTGNEVFGGTIFNNRLAFPNRLDAGNGVDPLTIPAVGESEDGAFVFMQGTSPGEAAVRARYLDDIEKPVLQPEATLSVPEFGAVDVKGGFDAAASRAGDVAVAFVQGAGDQRRIVASVYDKPPGRVTGYNTTNPRRLERLRWSPSINLFGPVVYRIVVDGRPIGQSTTPDFIVPPGAVADGTHRWVVEAVDRRGQVVPSRTRILRVDNTPPRLSAGFRRSGRTITVTAKAADRRSRLTTGLSRVVVDFGPGGFVRMGRRASRAVSGPVTVRVKAIDKAGNETLRTRRFG